MNGGFEKLPFRGQISKCCSHIRTDRLEVRPRATARVAAHCGSTLAASVGHRARLLMAQFSSLGCTPTHQEEGGDHQRPFSPKSENNYIYIYLYVFPFVAFLP